MSVGFDHPLVADYLTRLDAAASGLPPGRRGELVAEIREHVAEALGACGDDEPSVRGVLDRLGDPEEIVAAEPGAFERLGSPAPLGGPGTDPAPPSPWGPLELFAVLAMTVGAFLLPVVGPLAGLVSAWASERWTRREKWVATAWSVLTPLLLVVAAAGLFAVRSTTETGPATSVVEAPMEQAPMEQVPSQIEGSP